MATDTEYNNALIQIQKLANTSAEKIQKMVNSSNELQMKYNKEEAQKARDWQTNMSKTAHQMEVADLKKAGLNPVLSVNSGAQSYTTASASTDNDSGASAASGILGSQLGAISNMESSRMSSEATKTAAETSAAAMKKAAETSAKAQRAAAAQAAAAQKAAAQAAAAATKYSADKHLEATKVRAEADKWIAVNKQASTIAGFIDKMSTKTGTQKGIVSLLKKSANTFSSVLKWSIKNPDKYFRNTSGKITKDNFKLNTAGIKQYNKMTKALGLDVNKANRRLVVKCFVYQDSASYKILANRIDEARKKRIAARAATAHHGYVTVQRSGHR